MCIHASPLVVCVGDPVPTRVCAYIQFEITLPPDAGTPLPLAGTPLPLLGTPLSVV